MREEIVEVAVKNPNVILFFRGQKEDYQREGASTIIHSIFRQGSDIVSSLALKNRWDNLPVKSGFLMDELKARNIEGRNHLKNRKVLQWSVLQHYEAALIPLTDVTQYTIV